jgi:hypothetical protein
MMQAVQSKQAPIMMPNDQPAKAKYIDMAKHLILEQARRVAKELHCHLEDNLPQIKESQTFSISAMKQTRTPLTISFVN